MGSEKWLQELIKKLGERMGEEYQVTEVERPVPGMGGEARIDIMKKGERTGILLELDPGKVQHLNKEIGLEETADILAEQYLQKRDALLEELLAGEEFALMKERVIFALERKAMRRRCPVFRGKRIWIWRWCSILWRLRAGIPITVL